MLTIYVIFRRGRKVSRHNGFKTEEELINLVKEARKLFPDARVHLAEHLHPIPVDYDLPRSMSSLWCPYCGRWRNFKRIRKISKRATFCSVCGISDRDYNVKTQNDLWPKAFKGLTESGKPVRKTKADRRKKQK